MVPGPIVPRHQRGAALDGSDVYVREHGDRLGKLSDTIYAGESRAICAVRSSAIACFFFPASSPSLGCATHAMTTLTVCSQFSFQIVSKAGVMLYH